MDFDASGFYSCEVSTQTPIYTKPHPSSEIAVPAKQETQRDPPHVLTSKPVYQVGETLEANCTSSPARPIAHITWLVNGEPVSTVHNSLQVFTRALRSVSYM
ncbi:hypothetical protein B7P43_G17779 [Cryptotermes secundus]|uniref:Ig-like domain-containing protein n=1 Tax=Cryptotermes secundus TaxID=105785 RepID=A0A2J7QHA3_9NEOP|nr:hypothetical protein B7P43_G17779 [Cryptotermes secundus]